MQQVDTTAPIQQTPPIAVDTAPQVGLHPYMEHQPSTNNTNINATPRVETSHTLQPVVPTTDSTFHPFYFYDTSFLYDPSLIDTTNQSVGTDFDSLLSHYEWPEIQYRKSLFTGHAMPVKHRAQERTVDNAGGWIFGAVIVAVLLIALFLSRTRIKLGEALGSAFSLRVMARIFRDHNIIKTSALLPAGLIYMIEFALLGFYFGGSDVASSLDATPFGTYLVILVACIVGYLLRLGLISLLGNVFQNGTAIGLYNATSFLLHLVGAILLAPLLLLVFFYEPFAQSCLWTAIFIVVIIFIVRIIRGLLLILTHSTSSRFYLFYYLCIVEIVPFLIAWKQIISL